MKLPIVPPIKLTTSDFESATPSTAPMPASVSTKHIDLTQPSGFKASTHQPIGSIESQETAILTQGALNNLMAQDSYTAQNIRFRSQVYLKLSKLQNEAHTGNQDYTNLHLMALLHLDQKLRTHSAQQAANTFNKNYSDTSFQIAQAARKQKSLLPYRLGMHEVFRYYLAQFMSIPTHFNFAQMSADWLNIVTVEKLHLDLKLQGNPRHSVEHPERRIRVLLEIKTLIQSCFYEAQKKVNGLSADDTSWLDEYDLNKLLTRIQSTPIPRVTL